MLPYILMLAAIWDGPSWGDTGGEARYAEGWAQFFAVSSGVVLWLALGGLVLLAGLRGHVPQTWRIVAGALYLLAAIATVGAAQSYFSWPGGWSILVPALLPPLLALYGFCARLSVVAAGPLRSVPSVALGAVALVAFAAIPFAFVDLVGYSDRLAEHKRRINTEFDRIATEHREAARRWEADINKLDSDSPLAAWLEYLNGSTDLGALHQQALDGAQRANHRQADAVDLLDQGQIRRLAELWKLDIASTPALCNAYNQSLRRLATSDEVYELKVGEDLERQLPNLKFFVAASCDLDAGLAAAEARVRKLLVIYPDGDSHERWIKFLADLGALHHK